ncbi:MAG: ribonuclease Z [Candidatus Pacearchaeota archaeon]|jgi:ribonuclease Z
MSEKIKLTFLGTSGAIPTETRNHTAILLAYGSENILVDCGEGTQRQFRKAKLNPCKLTRILITHWHGDHVLGLPGLFQTLAFNDYKKELLIYGPKGTKNFINKIFETFVFVNNLKLKVFEVENGKIFENEDFLIESRRMVHNAPCNAYCFVRKGELRIDKNKLKKLKISEGPFLSDLKKGKSITFKNKKYYSKDLTFKEDDFKISFVLDTKLNEKIIPFVNNSEILVCEATFESGKESLAETRFHLTAKQAAEIAKKAKIKKLILTHISQRYEKNSDDVLKQSIKIFKNTELVDDLYEIVA